MRGGSEGTRSIIALFRRQKNTLRLKNWACGLTPILSLPGSGEGGGTDAFSNRDHCVEIQ